MRTVVFFPGLTIEITWAWFNTEEVMVRRTALKSGPGKIPITGEVAWSPWLGTVWARSLFEFDTAYGFLKTRQVWITGSQSVVGKRCVKHLNNCPDLNIGQRLNVSLQTVGKGFGFLRVCELFLPGWTGVDGVEAHYLFGRPAQWFVFGIEGFLCRNPLVVSPLIEPAGCQSLQAVQLGSQCGLPRDPLLPPQPVHQAYLILNVSRNLRFWVVTRAAPE